MLATARERETVTREVHTAIRHSAIYGLGGVLAKALGFFMLPFYTHYLTPSDYGILEILDLSMSLFGMFLNMGMTAALLRAYAAARCEEEKQKAVSTAFLFVIGTGVATFLLLVGLVRPVSAMLFGPNVPSTYLLMSFASFILGYISNLPRTYLRALEASGAFIIVDNVSLLLMLILNIYFIAFLRIGLVGILLSSLVVAGLQTIVLSWWTWRGVKIRFSAPLLRQMARFGLPLIFSNVALFVLNFADRFFLQHLRSLEVVGIYAVGYKFGFMMNYLLVQPFYAMWQARMYVVYAQPDHPKVFGQIFVLYSFLLTYAGLALAVLSPEIAALMVGSRFASSQEVIPVVALAYVFYGIGYYVQLGMYLTNRTSLIGVVSAAAAVLNLGLNYVLILHYGMLGAAWATLLSFFAIAAGSYWFSQRICPLPLAAGRVAKGMAVAVGLYCITRCWRLEPGVTMMFAKAGVLAIFPVVLWKTRILSAAESRTLASTRDTAFAGLLRLAGVLPGVRSAL